MQRKYFVSFSFEGGFGNCDITRETPISDMLDIIDVANCVRYTYKYQNVVILNFRKFEAEE